MPKTPHFSPELFDFLRRLRRNNRRDWFERHRDRYLEHVVEHFGSSLSGLRIGVDCANGATCRGRSTW